MSRDDTIQLCSLRNVHRRSKFCGRLFILDTIDFNLKIPDKSNCEDFILYDHTLHILHIIRVTYTWPYVYIMYIQDLMSVVETAAQTGNGHVPRLKAYNTCT